MQESSFVKELALSWLLASLKYHAGHVKRDEGVLFASHASCDSRRPCSIFFRYFVINLLPSRGLSSPHRGSLPLLLCPDILNWSLLGLLLLIWHNDLLLPWLVFRNDRWLGNSRRFSLDRLGNALNLWLGIRALLLFYGLSWLFLLVWGFGILWSVCLPLFFIFCDTMDRCAVGMD